MKFTCASSKDNGKVTVTVPQLEYHPTSDGVPATLLTRGSSILVTVKAGRREYRITFMPNRFRQGRALTAATNAWPRRLRLPKVGRGVEYEVTEVIYV